MVAFFLQILRTLGIISLTKETIPVSAVSTVSSEIRKKSFKFSWKKLLAIVTPFGKTSKATRTVIVVSQLAILFLLWNSSTALAIPHPLEIVGGFQHLQANYGFAHEFMISFLLTMKVTAISLVCGLLLSYMIIFPLFSGIPFVVSKARFLSLVGLVFIAQKIGDSADTKVVLLVFGMTVFFVTSMISVIKNITNSSEGQQELNHARTMRMNDWEVFLEVIVLGRMDTAFEMLRQCFAIVWVMLTAVETIAQSGGGIGVLLYKQQRTLSFEMIWAIQLTVMAVGILMDYVFIVIKQFLMPYSKISK